MVLTGYTGAPVQPVSLTWRLCWALLSRGQREGGRRATARTRRTARWLTSSVLSPGSRRARRSRVLLSLHHLFKLRYGRDVGPHQIQQRTVFRHPGAPRGRRRSVGLTGTRLVPGSAAPWKGNVPGPNRSGSHARLDGGRYFWRGGASRCVHGPLCPV